MDIRTMMTSGFTPEARKAWSITDQSPRQFRDGHPWYTLTRTDHIRLQQAHSIGLFFNTLTGRSQLAPNALGPDPLPVPSRIWSHRSPEGCDTSPHVGGDVLPKSAYTDTIIDVLTPGDGLRLLWFPDGYTSGALQEAGLHHDVVILEVRHHDTFREFPLLHRVFGPEHGRLVRPFDPVQEPNLAMDARKTSPA